MTGFDSKRKMALAKLPDDDDDDTQVYADTLTIVYQRGFADGKRSAQQAEPVQEQKYEKRIAPYSTTLSMLLNTTPPQQQAEPVSHAVIVGALFDFMGWLTTRKERLILSSTDNASPAADAIKVFAEMRGLSLDDARVQDWQNYTTPPQRPWVGLTDEDFLEACQLAERGNYLLAFQRIQIKLKEKNDH